MQILRQSNHLDRAVDNDLVSNGIVMLTPDRQVVSVNLAAAMLLKQPKSELIGKDFPYKIEPDSIYETERDLDGKREVLQFQCKLIKKNGQVKGFLIEISSITALKNAEGAHSIGTC